MATHPPSPPYAHLAPRPRSPAFPSIPAAAAFLAHYAVPLRADEDEQWRNDRLDGKDGGGRIVSASAFLGHVPVGDDHQHYQPHEEEHPVECVYQDVRSSLFPGQHFFSSLSDNDRGVCGDHTWSVERGWTGRQDVKADEVDVPRHDEHIPATNVPIDMGYITNRLGSLAATQQDFSDPPFFQATSGPGPARLIRRESSNASRSLSRQSSVRRANALNTNVPAPSGDPSSDPPSDPMSPASAFLLHFSPPPPIHTQAINIPRSGAAATDPGDLTSELSLSRIGSPTKYGEGIGADGGTSGSAVKVFSPMGVMTGDQADALALGPQRSFSTSATSGSWFPPHLGIGGGNGTSHMTMSTISSSSGISHHSAGSSTAPPDAAGSQVMHYTLGKVIGRGGFSTVRLAIDQHTGERFACRIIKRDDLSDQSGSLENFEIELEIWEEVSRVRHARILPLLEKWRDPEGYATYLITPLMGRGSLLDVLRREGGSEETARRWFPGIVEAVKALHSGWTGKDKDGQDQQAQGGYLHGDLKLDNFLVGLHGEICVCDFGLAQRIGLKTATPAGDERRGRREERRIIIHSREASPERMIPAFSSGSLVTPTASRQPSRSRPRFHSPYVSTTEVDHIHQTHQHVSRPSLPTFPTSSQLLHDHRPSHSRARDVSPSPGPRGRRASRSRTRRGATSSHAPAHIPVQTFPSASLPYACPELLRAPPSPPDLAQDIWALGIILHALLTSRLPFVDAYDPRLQMKIIRGEWVLPPGLGNEWTECLMGCLEVDPRRRWDIETLAASDAVQGWQEAKSRSKSRSRSRARAGSRTRVDLSPTDRVSGLAEPRARSRSRTRADYFAHPAPVPLVAHPGDSAATTPRTGRTRSRSNPAIAKLREHGYSHYDSPLELVPETEGQPVQDSVAPVSQPIPLYAARSPGRSHSSQSRHVFGAAPLSGRHRIDLDPAGSTRAHSTSSSSRNMSSSRSRSRDPVGRYVPQEGPGAEAVGTIVEQPMMESFTAVRGEVPAPRTSPTRNRSRASGRG